MFPFGCGGIELLDRGDKEAVVREVDDREDIGVLELLARGVLMTVSSIMMKMIVCPVR